MDDQRQQLLRRVADAISHVPATGIVRVAIDGVDGAGKTCLADELAALLQASGRTTIRASVDGFHHPKDVRYREGRASPEGFFQDSYDYEQLKTVLLDPLSPGGSRRYKVVVFDHRSDAPVPAVEQVAAASDILLFDGIFLHRPELRNYWDYSIFLDVRFDVSIPRGALRDGGSSDPAAPHNQRYVLGQELYLRRCEPTRSATVVINNDELTAPYIVRPTRTIPHSMPSPAAGQMSSFPTDYDAYAPTYAWARWAVPWVVQPLSKATDVLPAGTAVLEISCGTGSYIGALGDSRRDLAYFGFDISEPMLNQARNRGTSATFVHGDAAANFPFPDQTFGLAFAVDVIHHIDNFSRFFEEAHRILLPRGRLVMVTDSDDTLRRRSLTRFFPEILPIEMARYPAVPLLHTEAVRAGLHVLPEETASGQIPLDREFLMRLEAKCSSAMRLMAPAAHAAGMARVRAAAAKGEQWLSCYEVLSYVRPDVEAAA